MKERLKQNWYSPLLSFIILAAASFPFLDVYQLGHGSFFLTILAAICLITFLFRQFVITVPLYLCCYFISLYIYFPLGQSLIPDWPTAFYQEMLVSHQQILAGELNYMPKTIALVIILFFLIALAVLLIHYERIWLSWLLIIGYHLLLTVVNQIQLGISLLIITCASILFHQLKQQTVAFSRNKIFLYSSILLLFISGSAYSMYKFFPQAQSFLFYQTAAVRNYANSKGLYEQINRYGTSSASRSGFGEDDRQLGGPLTDDPTILFTAIQSKPHYWRVETKNYYTGTGWQTFTESIDTETDPSALLVTDPEYQGMFASETPITMNIDSGISYLPQPYGSFQLFLSSGQTIERIPEKNRINFTSPATELSFVWQEPAYQESDLQQANEGVADLQNTMLPTALPRVYELALSLTQNEESIYDKVKAIEQYLKTDETFQYSKTDTPFLPEGRDYVDYFLFDSKVGYCDNFSSAMIVMLRSLGIPSRWAKGFASGEITREYQDGRKQFSIRNGHAHSWPEVYFKGYGWIPFEPTPSFSNPESEENTAASESSESPSSTSNSSSTETENTTSNSTQQAAEAEKDSAISFDEIWRSIRPYAFGLLGLFLVIGIFLLRKNFFLLRFKLYRKMRPADFIGAYQHLLKQAEKKLVRKAEEPLAPYGQRLELTYPSLGHSFSELTALYEQTLYGNSVVNAGQYDELLKKTAQILASLT
ncbi:DUF4129 domain-containing transglutaminase family protein [Enterococcus sp. LJL128]